MTFVLDAAGERHRLGRLEFHDLLVLARDLVRTDPSVRRSLHEEYDAVLLDEFQDTDPIQLELALLITSDGPLEDHPGRLVPRAGRLFLVGDPKQSIYRFRRADVALTRDARTRLGRALELTSNFRSRAGILAWVNTVFTELMRDDGSTQVPYRPLDAPGIESHLDDPVTLLGSPWPAPADLGTVRAHEAADIVAFVEHLTTSPTAVRARDDERGATRAARYDDIAILVPSRRALPALEVALEDAGIPLCVESETLVFATPEVRDLTALLTAIASPADEVAVVAALRSPAFACRDDELVEFVQAGGHWNPEEPLPAALGRDHAVVRSLTTLASSTRRAGTNPSTRSWSVSFAPAGCSSSPSKVGGREPPGGASSSSSTPPPTTPPSGVPACAGS